MLFSVFNCLSYLPGLSKILSHSELISDVAVTTLTRKSYNEIQSQSKKEDNDSIKL